MGARIDWFHSIRWQRRLQVYPCEAGYTSDLFAYVQCTDPNRSISPSPALSKVDSFQVSVDPSYPSQIDRLEDEAMFGPPGSLVDGRIVNNDYSNDSLWIQSEA
jgi:hypothetical protein